MSVSGFFTWAVLAGYGALILWMMPGRVSPTQFFGGRSDAGDDPGFWLLVASAAITWIFAKSLTNAANLAGAFGIAGGIGYAGYYVSFVVAGIAIYFLRTRGGHTSLAGFLTAKYGALCAKLFLIAIAIRLINEVWSNTKVSALYFGDEGSGAYWIAAAAVTGFTAYYSWRGGLRSSLLTDGAQMLLAAVLLAAVLIVVGPGLSDRGLPVVSREVSLAGFTFLGLALVQVLSYPFHDPALTDRAFRTTPKIMLRAFLTAGLISGAFVLLFSVVGLYGLSVGAASAPTLMVPALLGLPMVLVFNAIMLTSAGSTLDSTFASSAKLAARDWSDAEADPGPSTVQVGRWVILGVAVAGNLPLLGIYFGDAVGPAIIAATTISGTMVMGLAPIFLLSFLSRAGRLSFHLAFWPGLTLGVVMTVQGATGLDLFPAWVNIGTGIYAVDLGVNLYGLALCTVGYLVGAVLPSFANPGPGPKSRPSFGSFQ